MWYAAACAGPAARAYVGAGRGTQGLCCAGVGWYTGAGSGSRHPAVTVLGGVKFLVLKPSSGNMHTWSLCLRWLWGRAVQEQVQVQVQDVWLAV